MYRNYWAEELISKWEQWLYPDKPVSATMNEWRAFEKKQKETPVRYFFADTLPEFISDVVFYPASKLHDFIWFLRYRFSAKYSYYKIDTKLKPGYYDCDTRMLHGMFEMIVDHVECEKAWMQRGVNWRDENEKPVGFFERWTFRDPAAGLRYIEWEITLDSETLPEEERNITQATVAREIQQIYLWWKYDRPQRADPMDMSGWSEYCSGRDFMEDIEPKDESRVKKMLKKTQEIEELQNLEDEEYLIRLIKIRHHLWT